LGDIPNEVTKAFGSFTLGLRSYLPLDGKSKLMMVLLAIIYGS